MEGLSRGVSLPLLNQRRGNSPLPSGDLAPPSKDQKAEHMKKQYEFEIVPGDKRVALARKVLAGLQDLDGNPIKKSSLHAADHEAIQWMQMERKRAEERSEKKWRHKFQEWVAKKSSEEGSVRKLTKAPGPDDPRRVARELKLVRAELDQEREAAVMATRALEEALGDRDAWCQRAEQLEHYLQEVLAERDETKQKVSQLSQLLSSIGSDEQSMAEVALASHKEHMQRKNRQEERLEVEEEEEEEAEVELKGKAGVGLEKNDTGGETKQNEKNDDIDRMKDDEQEDVEHYEEANDKGEEQKQEEQEQEQGQQKEHEDPSPSEKKEGEQEEEEEESSRNDHKYEDDAYSEEKEQENDEEVDRQENDDEESEDENQESNEKDNEQKQEEDDRHKSKQEKEQEEYDEEEYEKEDHEADGDDDDDEYDDEEDQESKPEDQ